MKSRFVGQDKSIHQQKATTGVLLTNLGTPEQATPQALRNYLREFLSDPRVVEIPRILWMLILHGIILRVRPAKSAKLYQNIWTGQGSPLRVISQQQKTKFAKIIQQQFGEQVMVDIAMRYGQPGISAALQRFQQGGVNNIVILPLYPQYAGPTTGSTFDAVVAEIGQWRWIPSVHFLSSYHDNPLYIDALASSVLRHIAQHGKPDKLVLSFHGMPKLFLTWGDPYYCFCVKTTRLLMEKLAFSDDDFVMTFQSRFGKAEWLKPYTDETIKGLPETGAKNIAVISPAFSADCLETLDEIEREYREIFLQAGGEHYHYIPALNDNDDHIAALVALVSPHLSQGKTERNSQC